MLGSGTPRRRKPAARIDLAISQAPLSTDMGLGNGFSPAHPPSTTPRVSYSPK
jgi:hypothetical protein